METFYPSQGGRDVLVLIVEDERLSRKALAILLAACGYTTEAFATAEEAQAAIDRGSRAGLAVVDMDLPGISGAEFVEYLARAAPLIHPVILTAASEERVRRTVARTDIRYLRKPIKLKDLLIALEDQAQPN